MKTTFIDASDSSGPSNETDAYQPCASKRMLLKAVAWAPPAIIALTLPRSSYAANVSGTDNSARSKDNGNNGNHYGQLKK